MARTPTKREIQAGDRVLVTGGVGGVGRHIVQALVDAGCEVRAVDLNDPDENVAELVDLDAVEWVKTDLRSARLSALVQDCAAVVHTAAMVGLSESYDELVETNVDVVHDLYAAASDAGVRHFVHFSAGQIYEPARGLRDEGGNISPLILTKRPRSRARDFHRPPPALIGPS
ncbi:MAG: SDR family NAD(P)-dependent oxidoreductase [bacterium]